VSRRRVLRSAAALAAVAAVGVPVAIHATTATAGTAASLADDADLPQLSTPAVDLRDDTYVFSRGLDGSLLYSRLNGQFFTPFSSLGGQLVGDPTAVRLSNGPLAFVRGTDNQVYTNMISNFTDPGGFVAVPGLRVTGEVAALPPPWLTPPDTVQIFARGTDRAVFTNTRTNGVWSGWTSLGGFITSNITAVWTFPPGFGEAAIRLLVRGADHRVYTMLIFANRTTPWTPVGDVQITSNVATVNPGDSALFGGNEFYVRGTDNSLRAYDFNRNEWANLGGIITSDISVVQLFAFATHIYVRGADNALYVNRRESTGSFNYSGFQSLGGVLTNNPVAVGAAAVPLARDHVFARGTDNALYINVLPADTTGTGPFTGFGRFAGPPHS
jgi:hypothetical protein